MGRSGIPCAAGADVPGGYYRYELDYPPDEENWPEPITRRSGPPDQAVSLLKHSIEQGAVIVATGPCTNLMLLGKTYPGMLKQASLFLTGGHVFAIPAGDNKIDYDIQVDMHSAHYVLEHANPTVALLAVTCQTALRRAYLPRLAQAGRLGELITLSAESEKDHVPHASQDKVCSRSLVPCAPAWATRSYRCRLGTQHLPGSLQPSQRKYTCLGQL